MQVHPVILCGGSGSRLWPLSRKAYPKQFIDLLGNGGSLFQRAAQLCDAPGFADPLVITGSALRFKVIEQLAAIERTAAAVLVEPEGRNTAPATLAAALHLVATDPDALMLVLPSDHFIADFDRFRAAVAQAAHAAQAGDFVTFGIEPTGPATGYGYLELADAGARTATTPQKLAAFVEKPTLDRATAMLETGRYLWNAGIFLMSAAAVVSAFARLAPDIHAAVVQALADARPQPGGLLLDKDRWGEARSISLDFAIMEHADNLSVMPFADGWSDVGDWNSVGAISPVDADGNLLAGTALAMDCRDSVLHCDVPGMALVGIELVGMIAVATPDGVLVAPRHASQRVTEAVARLRAEGYPQADNGCREERPWGWYESLAQRGGFQIKQIFVKPGEALSLQSHSQRAEHWIIMRGAARVTVAASVQDLVAGDYVHIPLGAVHRLENPGDEPILMIEVQTGDYLGEDDIIRYADRYARS